MPATAIVAYLVLFATAGFLFVFLSLLVGRLVRARVPLPGKLETYECGEPAVGSSFVQFDLRFYVVALVFLIFDVEVAFFFPWAVVYGKATQLLGGEAVENAAVERAAPAAGRAAALSPAAAQTLRDLGVRRPGLPFPSGGVEANRRAVDGAAQRLALVAMTDMAVFFGVLLLGFGYVWWRGDLDWVRAVSRRRMGPAGAADPPRAGASTEPAASAR